MNSKTLGVFGVGPSCRPLAAKTVFGGTPVSTEWFSDNYKFRVITSSLFPMAQEERTPRSTKTESVIYTPPHVISLVPSRVWEFCDLVSSTFDFLPKMVLYVWWEIFPPTEVFKSFHFGLMATNGIDRLRNRETEGSIPSHSPTQRDDHTITAKQQIIKRTVKRM